MEKGTGPVMRRTLFLALAAMLTVSLVATAQSTPRIIPDEVECLPIGDNGVAWTTVENNQPDTTVRLNFRRLHDTVEDIYWVPMYPTSQGRYWGIFPKAADQKLDRHDLEEERENVRDEYRWAQWWRAKQGSDDRDPNRELDEDLIRERASLGKQVPREWLAEMDDETFQDWLEQLENEPAEHFVSVHDATGRQLARSKTKVTEVRDNCRPDLNPQQRGEAENLTVGETAHWQRGEEVFHWLCDGIVSRVAPNEVKRGDEVCRACVIAWYKKPGIILPTAVTVAGGGAIIINDSPKDLPGGIGEPPVSPSEP